VNLCDDKSLPPEEKLLRLIEGHLRDMPHEELVSLHLKLSMECMDLRKQAKEAHRAALEAAAQAIPDTWLDPLLTGENAVIGQPPYGCPDVERLLKALQMAIRALAQEG
jgi:hypothetical protein